MRTLIESIELDLETNDLERIIRRINLMFPVYYNGQKGDRIRMPEENTVECVVLLSPKSSDRVIHVTVEFGEGEGKALPDSVVERTKN